MTTTIRWKKRLRGWAGFVGSSRVAAVRITREAGAVHVRVELAGEPVRWWYSARHIDAAKAWAARQLEQIAEERQPSRPPSSRALFVHADGKTEWLDVSHQAHSFQMPALRKDFGRHYTEMTPLVEKRTFRATRFCKDVCDPRDGIYAQFELRVFAEDGAAEAIVEAAASQQLRVMEVAVREQARQATRPVARVA